MRRGKKRVKSRYSRSCLYACCGIFLKNPLDKIKKHDVQPFAATNTIYIYIILNAHNVDETVKFLMETVGTLNLPFSSNFDTLFNIPE